MDAHTAIRAIINLVPQWYAAAIGPHDYSLNLGDTTIRFYATRRPTPQLAWLLRKVRRDLSGIVGSVASFPTSVGVDLIQEYFAEAWLHNAAPHVAWRKLFNYARDLQHRTYENAEITFNFVIREGEGEVDVTDMSIQKVLDPLAGSNWTYIEMDPQLRLTGYDEVGWSEIEDITEYKYHPEFLHPFASVLEPGDFSVHKTRRGDLVIMNAFGLLAARRKGQWKLYDPETLKNSMGDAVRDYRVGCNLFDVVFDLSFRRHGALLIYDPEGQIAEHITNPESILADGERRDTARGMLAASLEGIKMGAAERSRRKKGIFLEIAGLDGAVVFDSERIVAVGAMVRSHPHVPGQFGARSTAAHSAYLHGARPVKISADGEITFYFTSRAPNGRQEVLARMECL